MQQENKSRSEITIKRVKLSALFMFCILLFSIFTINIGDYIYPKYKILNIFDYNKNDNIHYRIPGLIVTRKGTLLAYCEERQGTDDRAYMNIVYRRSVDGGKTWSKKTIIAEGITSEQIISSPVMVADSRNRIHCFYVPNVAMPQKGGWVAYVYSDDDGITWSSPKDISSATREEERNLFATGPGHGIELKNGRILIPVWFAVRTGEEQRSEASFPSASSTLYSDDYGETWNLGEAIPGTDSVPNPNECTLVELSDGSVMINIRNESDQYRRATAVSADGVSGWTELCLDDELQDCHCFGSLQRYDAKTILFVNPKEPTSRSIIAIRQSNDDCETWTKGKTILYRYGGYSDINVSNKGPWIYVLSEIYQEGTFSISFIKVNKKWLDNG